MHLSILGTVAKSAMVTSISDTEGGCILVFGGFGSVRVPKDLASTQRTVSEKHLTNSYNDAWVLPLAGGSWTRLTQASPWTGRSFGIAHEVPENPLWLDALLHPRDDPTLCLENSMTDPLVPSVWRCYVDLGIMGRYVLQGVDISVASCQRA